MFCKLFKTIFGMNRNYNENNIDFEEMNMMLKSDKNCILLDVRSPQEYKEQHLERGINIPLYDLQKKVINIIPSKENVIIVYCQTGNRSIRAVKMLTKMGYKKVYNLKGGLDNI